MLNNQNTIRNWMRRFILENNITNSFGDYYEQFKAENPESNWLLKSFNDEMRREKKRLDSLGISSLDDLGLQEKNPDSEIIEENVRLAKQYQKQQDLNRIKNKSFREYARTENNIEEYSKALIEELKKIDVEKFLFSKNLKTFSFNSEIYGVINISDSHFNELITPLEGMNNKYDFKVSSCRLKLLCEKAKKIFNSFGIKNVLITFLGDLINSNRRNEELLASSTNRSKATLLATLLFEQFFLDFINDGYSLSVSCSTGNESRLDLIHAWSDVLVTENFDYTIFNILKLMFRKIESVTFLEGDYKEQVISLNGFNILVLHGENVKTEKDVQLLIGKYLAQGIAIHHVMTGHLHSAKISDYSSRCSSLCGANAYSNRALGLISKASQNIHIVDPKNKLIDSMKIDLQIDDTFCDGYNIDDQLVAYNAKSVEKTLPKKTILEIKI